MIRLTVFRLAALLCVLAGALSLDASQAIDPKTLTQDQLFTTTRIWDAHVRFTPEQWKGLVPVQAAPPGRMYFPGDPLLGSPNTRNGFRTVQSGLDFQYVHGELEFGGATFKDVGVRFKGNATYNERSIALAKNSLKIDLNKYVKGQKIAGVETLNFHNAISEPGWMNEVLSYRLYRDAGVPAPRTAYVRVHLTVPGLYERKYTGLYILAENIDENFIEARIKSADGAILKPVSTNLFNHLSDTWNERYQQTYDPKTDITDAEKQRVIDFCRLVTSAPDAEFAAQIGGFVDMPAFAKYMAVVAWLNNSDSILERGQNFYMHLNPATKMFTFIPWDQDNSFGMFSGQPNDLGIRGNIHQPWTARVRFLERMFAVPAFRTAYLAALRDYTQTVFVASRFPPIVAELVKTIRPEIEKEPPTPPYNRRPAGFTNVSMFDLYAQGERGPLYFFPRRAETVLAQLAKP
jgi:spore coat protein H